MKLGIKYVLFSFFVLFCLGSQPSQKETRNDDPSLEEVSCHSIVMPRAVDENEKEKSARENSPAFLASLRVFARLISPFPLEMRNLSNGENASFFALLSCRSICQMLVNFSGVEFQRTVSKFRKRKGKSLSCVHVFHKT